MISEQEHGERTGEQELEARQTRAGADSRGQVIGDREQEETFARGCAISEQEERPSGGQAALEERRTGVV